jgi:cephalosporin-C deacetylase-like acetyl esterase
MTRTDISFQTSDGVTLRGWFFEPETRSKNEKLPCLILVHGFTCIKEMALDNVASRLISALPLTCLVFDYRGFGSSDNLPGQPRLEVIPSHQCSDIRDAITYAQTKDGIDKDKIGLWGYSFGGGHAAYLGAVDRRVKAVISLAPATYGWENFLRLARPDLVQQLNQGFEMDRISRAAGNPPTMLPVVSADPHGPCAVPSPESYEFFSAWAHEKSTWKNELTLRSAEELRAYTLPSSHLEHITPTPVFMAINTRDTNTPPDVGMRAYAKLSEPKELCIVEANHYEMLGSALDSWHEKQVAFLQRTLCKA